MNWQLSGLAGSLKSSLSLSPTQPDTRSNKYWLFQILCLSLVLGWQSKQLDCYSTAFHPDKPPSHPRASVCCSYTLQYCFLHVGGPRHFKAPRVGAPVGWQAATAQLSRITLVSAKQTHVDCWVTEWLSEWLSELCIGIISSLIIYVISPNFHFNINNCGQENQFIQLESENNMINHPLTKSVYWPLEPLRSSNPTKQSDFIS